MLPVVLAILGAVVSVLAFPPFGPGWLVVPGVALFLASLRLAKTPRQGLLLGGLYGMSFYGGLMWWMSKLGVIAAIPLVVALASFTALFGWWLSRYSRVDPGRWLVMAIGSWALMELVRYHFPFNGLEWGANGYALSDSAWTRFPAVLVGTSGLTVLVVALAGSLALAGLREWSRIVGITLGVALALIAGALGYTTTNEIDEVALGSTAIVQGSTPCPFEHCPPNERYDTYIQHLELTKKIPKGSASLVVWSEGSTGSVNADPVLNQEVGLAIGAEARRIGARFLVGGDRTLSDTQWVNANVVFDPSGEIVGEYRKQHPVPFGEYIPFRPLFEWIPALDQVPRDMIPGDGPVIFDDGQIKLGSVISFEGAFSRYARQHTLAGAEVIVVATNEGSYGTTPASDQFIGMTRMRAVELGVPIIHAAVTGKSTIIDANGEFGDITGLGTQEILEGLHGASRPTPYAFAGDFLLYIAAIGGAIMWWRTRPLVGSETPKSEED